MPLSAHRNSKIKAQFLSRDSRRFAAWRQLAHCCLAAACLPALAACGIDTSFGQGFNQGSNSASALDAGASAISYADSADLALTAPLIADVTILKASSVKAQLPAGISRYYVKASVNALLRAPAALPPEISFLVDQKLDADGRAPALKNNRFFVYARPVQGQPAAIQLIAPDSIVSWSAENNRLAHLTAKQVTSGQAPPAIGQIISAFHFPGTVQGEGETQIFLDTASGDPVSLRVVSRPGTQRQWGLTLGEVVAAAPAPPPAETLQWYRLSCGKLPAQIAADKLSSASQNANAQAQADYQFIRQSLGPCPRTRR